MGDVMDPKRVRLVYFKSMRIVHPDKLKADASPEQKVAGNVGSTIRGVATSFGLTLLFHDAQSVGSRRADI